MNRTQTQPRGAWRAPIVKIISWFRRFGVEARTESLLSAADSDQIDQTLRKEKTAHTVSLTARLGALKASSNELRHRRRSDMAEEKQKTFSMHFRMQTCPARTA